MYKITFREASNFKRLKQAVQDLRASCHSELCAFRIHRPERLILSNKVKRKLDATR